MGRAQSDAVGAIVFLTVSAIIVSLGLLLFDMFGQMGPQSGPFGDANQSLIDAGSILPLAIGGGLAIVVVGMISQLGE